MQNINEGKMKVLTNGKCLICAILISSRDFLTITCECVLKVTDTL